MSIIQISCRKATELIEKKINFRLSFVEKVRLHFHEQICIYCRRYEKQSMFIEHILHEHSLHLEFVPSVDREIVELAEKRILEKLSLK